MSKTNGVTSLIARLECELEAEFPGWSIKRESDDRWRAVRIGWGALYGQSVAELRDRLARASRGLA